MDEKPSEEGQLKITRSRARHERRKRLKRARKAAEQLQDSESPETLSGTEGLSKSKLSRLRKKNKTKNCTNSAVNSDNNTGAGSPASQVCECAPKISTEEICTSESKVKIDKDLAANRIEVIEPILSRKTSESPKVSATEHELLENEKNLKISESLRPNATSSRKNESPRITGNSKGKPNLEYIIKKDSRQKVPVTPEKIVRSSQPDESTGSDKSANTLSSSGGKKDRTSDEVSLPNLEKESPIELSKFSATSEPMSCDPKMAPEQIKAGSMTREQIKAEREAKKAAKAAKAKGKAKPEVATEKIVEASTKEPAKEHAKESAKKPTTDVTADEVDADLTAATSQLKISESKKKPEVIVASSSADGKSKAELRAERRAKQEAQRAAKQGQAVEKIKVKVTNVTAAPTKVTAAAVKPEDSTKKVVKRPIVNENAHEVNLFKHLYYEREQALINAPTVNSDIHPAIVRLGVQYRNKVIIGSNARCIAFLAAVKQLIEDFERPSQADFTRGLETSLQESSTYLHHCRPLAVSMHNALRHLKWQMTQLDASTSDEEAKSKLGNAIDMYIKEQFDLADEAISRTIRTKVSNGDVILTYGYSSLINKILREAYDAGRKFRVVVVDGRPWLEGREQLRRLAKHGLECSYVLINALSFIMPEITKVFLGAHAILANGAVMSRVGTAQVALMAKAFNVPVLVACEKHKTCERVQTDSIVYNELADADELAQNLMGSSKKTSLVNWRAKKSLNLLNLTYDVTPADLVTAVVTDLAILPCTSVPVILRIKPSEI